VGGSGISRARPEEDTLFPAVEAGGKAAEYLYIVNSSRHSVKLKPVAANCDITVNEIEVTSNTDSAEIPLNYGNNFIPVTVKPLGGETLTYNILVRRKQPVLLSALEAENCLPRVGDQWIYSYNFPYSADTVKLRPTIPLGAVMSIEGIAGQYTNGQTVDIPVNGVTVGGSKMLIATVSQDFNENERLWTDQYVYIISLYRMATDSPSAVASYLPAPGQFVNQSAYSDPAKTLSVSSSLITLGAFGGSVVYYFDEPIVNDELNP
jgi:hypothetical protein